MVRSLERRLAEIVTTSRAITATTPRMITARVRVALRRRAVSAAASRSARVGPGLGRAAPPLAVPLAVPSAAAGTGFAGWAGPAFGAWPDPALAGGLAPGREPVWGRGRFGFFLVAIDRAYRRGHVPSQSCSPLGTRPPPSIWTTSTAAARCPTHGMK